MSDRNLGPKNVLHPAILCKREKHDPYWSISWIRAQKLQFSPLQTL